MPTLGLVILCQPFQWFEGVCQVPLIGPARSLHDGDPTLEDWFRVRVATPSPVELGQVLQRLFQVWMVRTACLLQDGKRTLTQRLGHVVALRISLVEARQAVEWTAHVRMVGPTSPFRDGEHAQVELLGLSIATLLGIKVDEVVELVL